MDISNYIKENVPHLLLDDPKTKYKCYNKIESDNFSFLHKLVMETRKHKILEDYLKNYLQTEKGKSELNLKNTIGFTPLMLSCRNSGYDSTFETVKILVENKANLDLQDNDGRTALILSCYNFNNDNTLKTVKILIENKANLDLQDNEGRIALMFSCCNSYPTKSIEIVKLLIENKANLDLQTNYGYTALIIACYNINKIGTLEIIKILIENKANLDLQSKTGLSALSMICRISKTNPLEIVKILIENKANLDLQDNKGYTALMYLLETNYIQDYIEYYKMQDKNLIKKYITEYTIPINNYDLLVDSNIISSILPFKYKESKYHTKIKIHIDLRILEQYEIKKSECMICSEIRKILVCNYNHHTCFGCLHKLNFKCEFCKCFL